MRNIARATLTLYLLACFTSIPLRAQETSSEADELIANNLEAIGGLENAREISSLTMRGDVTVPSMNVDMAITIYQKRPNKMRSEVYIPSAGQTIISGFDGTTAWTVNPMAGGRPMKLEGEQAEQMLNQAEFDPPFVDYEKKGHTVEYLGEEEVDGRAMERLKVIRSDSMEAVYFIDSETNLVSRIEMEGVNPMTNQPATIATVLSDYRDIGGIKMPFSMETMLGDQVFQQVRMESIQANSAIDDSQFTMPEGEAVESDNW